MLLLFTVLRVLILKNCPKMEVIIWVEGESKYTGWTIIQENNVMVHEMISMCIVCMFSLIFFLVKMTVVYNMLNNISLATFNQPMSSPHSQEIKFPLYIGRKMVP